ncbi:MAG: peroxide stress protein YaaA [Acidimicrobiia bacterium]|nr:peroxide stress protein YaaA [Acidimicrobiia bacterium]
MPRSHSRPLILLPPSESKAADGDGPTWRRGTMTDAALDGPRSQLLPLARRAGASRPRAATMPAIERYTGVLYGELDWSSLDAAARRRGATDIRVVSGLWGLVAPADPIPHYKLKMSTSFEGTGKLSTWWRPRLAPTMAALSAGRVVWDLLPLEHSAAVDWSKAPPHRRITVRFVDRHDRTVSHWNKLLKGAVVRWLLTEQPPGPEALEHFEHPAGYRLDVEGSTFGEIEVALVMRST